MVEPFEFTAVDFSVHFGLNPFFPSSKNPYIKIIGKFANAEKSCCVNIHSVHPYFFISLPPQSSFYTENSVKDFLEFVCSKINAKAEKDLTSSFGCVVYKCTFVIGRSMYGYHSQPQNFCKILFNNPHVMNRVADWIRVERLLGYEAKVYEAHISYIMQFMLDYDIYGMDTVSLSEYTATEKKTFKGPVEFDALGKYILNRQRMKPREDVVGCFKQNFIAVPSLRKLWESMMDIQDQSPIQTQFTPTRSQSITIEDMTKKAYEKIDSLLSRELFISKQNNYCDIEAPWVYDALLLDEYCDDQQAENDWLGSQFVDNSEVDESTEVMDDDMGDSTELEDNNIFQFDGADTGDERFANTLSNVWSPLKENLDENKIIEAGILGISQSMPHLIEENVSLSSPSHVSENIRQCEASQSSSHLIVENVDLSNGTFHASKNTKQLEAEILEINQNVLHATKENVDLSSVSQTSKDIKQFETDILGSSQNVPHAIKEDVNLSSSFRKSENIRQFEVDYPNPAFVKANEFKSRLWNFYPPPNLEGCYLAQEKYQQSTGCVEKCLESGFGPLFAMLVECHANARQSLLPNPEIDPLQAIFTLSNRNGCNNYKIFKVQDEGKNVHLDVHIVICEDEVDLILRFLEYVVDVDADLILGYEMHKSSWGYIIVRCRRLGIPFTDIIGRYPCKEKKSDQWKIRKTTTVFIPGRPSINVWRVLRSELELRQYSLQFTVEHIFGIRLPAFSHDTLTEWYRESPNRHQWKVLMYYLDRLKFTLALLQKTQFITRTIEFAKLFGMDFSSVISRGSQFKVESLILRMAKQENLLAYSPASLNIVSMRAPEGLPLIMEPIPGFYKHPVVVLDFQSLYPSVMIAYNMCFTTCIGKLHTGVEKAFGASTYGITKEDLELLQNDLCIVMPNNVGFVKSEVREGILGKMLYELLTSRISIKSLMKRKAISDELKSLLDARQLGFKFIANVTYGYTSANFSGRMPCIDIADSIVLTARDILERAIRTVNEHCSWNAKVIYGDTDSLFVQLENASIETAHRIGREIAQTITGMNAYPVRLKFEKVYRPCVLLSKKRYVGYKTEQPEQSPIIESKGIETIRRDSCPLVANQLELCLKLLFDSANLMELKKHLYKVWNDVLTGNMPLQEFIFAKEVRLGTYANENSMPPAAVLSMNEMRRDPMTEPEYGARVPFVIAAGPAGTKLAQLALTPQQFIIRKCLKINGKYYIERQMMPAFTRIFSLAGADVLQWYSEMPCGRDFGQLKQKGQIDIFSSICDSREKERKRANLLTLYQFCCGKKYGHSDIRCQSENCQIFLKSCNIDF